jgi:hypothetical protein
MEPSDYDEIPLLRHFFFQRYGTTGGIKQMGTQSISENGSGAWVAL